MKNERFLLLSSSLNMKSSSQWCGRAIFVESLVGSSHQFFESSSQIKFNYILYVFCSYKVVSMSYKVVHNFVPEVF